MSTKRSTGSNARREAPAPSPDAVRRLLYEFGDTLEGAGEQARALAVFLELQGDRAPTATWHAAWSSSGAPGQAAEADLLRRLLFAAYFFEVGFLLVIVPWSTFWDHNASSRPIPGCTAGRAASSCAGPRRGWGP